MGNIFSSRVLRGLARAALFCRYILPIIIAYQRKRLIDKLIRAVADEEWEALHAHYAPKCLEIAKKMEGFYIKIGQHMATAGVNSLPTVYVEHLTTLLEHCPAQPFSTVKAIVEQDLGPLPQTFESFDEQPMNAASTGQVHSAKLLGGHEVVVKVQHPDAEWTFGVDLCLFLWTAQALSLPGKDILKQVQENLNCEFDYVREAGLQREAVGHLAAFPNIVVPLPVDGLHPKTPSPSGLCTKRVLVMDKLFGTSLADWGRAQMAAEAQRQGKTVRDLQEEFKNKSIQELESMRPSAFALAMYFMMQRMADMACNTVFFTYNWLGLGHALGRPAQYVFTTLPPDIYRVSDELLTAQGHLILNCGFVNADPHAGNVMLLTDGRIALIDWGQVVKLTTEQRCSLAGLFIAVADGDDPMSAHYMRALGGRTKHNWDWTCSMWAKLASWSLKELEECDWGPISEAMVKVDPTLSEADSVIVMTFKNQLYTRQVIAMLGFPAVNSAVNLRGHAEKCLRAAGRPLPKTRLQILPIPPQVQELLSDETLQRGEEGAHAQHAKEKGSPVRAGWPLSVDLAAVVLVAYLIGMAVKYLQAPPALSVLVTPAVAAALIRPVLRAHARSCCADPAVGKPGDTPSGSFDARGWEL